MINKLPPEIQEADAAVQAQMVETSAQMAPQAEAPYSPETLPMLVGAMNSAFATLSGGQVPELPEPEPVEGMTQLPGEVFSGLIALQGALDQAAAAGVPGAEEYSAALDLEANAVSDKGVRTIIATLGEMETDQQFVEALATTPESMEEEVAEEPTEDDMPTEDNIDELM